jgi:hypothetical protein
MKLVGSRPARAERGSHRWFTASALLVAAIAALGCPAPGPSLATLSYTFVNDTDAPAELWIGSSDESNPANIVAARASRQSSTTLDADPNPTAVRTLDLQAHVRIDGNVTSVTLHDVGYQTGRTTPIEVTWNGTTLRILAGSPQ